MLWSTIFVVFGVFGNETLDLNPYELNNEHPPLLVFRRHLEKVEWITVDVGGLGVYLSVCLGFIYSPSQDVAMSHYDNSIPGPLIITLFRVGKQLVYRLEHAILLVKLRSEHTCTTFYP